MKNIILVVITLFIFNTIGYPQCYLKTINRSDGTTVKYFNPVGIGGDNDRVMAIAITSNGVEYFFNTSVFYSNNSIKAIGTLMIELSNNSSLNLSLFTSELAVIKGLNVAIGVYKLSETDITKLLNTDIKKVVYQETGGKFHMIFVSNNSDIAKKQIKCIEFDE